MPASIADGLERLYAQYNRTQYIRPDPLELVLGYEDPLEQEVAGLIAASFALGRVAAIVETAGCVLDRLRPLRDTVVSASRRDLERWFSGFVYRFYRSEHVVALLLGIQSCLRRFGSLENCYAACTTTLPASSTSLASLDRFVSELRSGPGAAAKMLAVPGRGSACKRLHLFLRWMVRRDDVDPGPWRRVHPSTLIVPIDVHMLRVCRLLGLTKRNDAGYRTAVEITERFRGMVPHDPVRFDFALTRLGIHPNLDYDVLGRFVQCPGLDL